MCKVCSSLGQKWGNERAITGSKIILTSPLGKPSMAAKFKIDGSVLTRDNFADVLIEIKYFTTPTPSAN